MKYILILCCCVIQALAVTKKQPRVVVETGAVVGKYEKSYAGQVFQAFWGIPYAKPPVSGDRFKEPQRLEKTWIGDYNATKPGSICLQLDHMTRTIREDGSWSHDVIGDEDCLFINVFTADPGVKNKPVIVYIHMGSFMFGSSSFYSPEYIMDNPNIVFVSFNYRLGVLGFLSTGDSVVPGNNGLKDQVMALEWIQRNIDKFGGDAKRVTIVGLSAGGASVHYHYLSPLSEGLFHKGISYSGTALSPWAFNEDGWDRTVKLAGLLGCPVSDSKILVKCLRRRSGRHIVERVADMQVWLYNPFNVFGPVAESGSLRPFIDQRPIDILKQGKAKDLPWITGLVSAEGLYPAADFVGKEHLLKELNDRWIELSPHMLFYKSEDSNQLIAETARREYIPNEIISKNTIKEITDLLGDRLFVEPAITSAKLLSAFNTQNVYLYWFDFKSKGTWTKFMSRSDDDFGVCHGDDMIYVFKIPNTCTRQTEDDLKMAGLLTGMVYTLAETGKVPKSLNWTPVSKNLDEPLNYLHISSPTEYKMITGDNIGRIQFWQNLLPRPSAGQLKDEL